MRKSSLYQSLALHAIAVFLMVVDLPFGRHKDMTLDQAPIIVDLSEVKISEMTNLPSKAEFAEKDSPATKIKEEPQKAEERSQPTEQTTEQVVDNNTPNDEAPDNQNDDPKQDFIVPPQPSKPKLPDKKPEPKKITPPPAKKPTPPQAKKPETPKTPAKSTPKADNSLKDLLATVNNMEKKLGDQNSNATIKHGTQVNNMGIEGGIGGSYFSDLSISETDAVASRVRSCWNLDPGAMGIEDMIIEIRVYLGKNGNVLDVDILDKTRYNSDRYFRSVADSAKRAVYVSQQKYNVFAIFAQKYPQKYDMWKTMLLRFNPISRSVY